MNTIFWLSIAGMVIGWSGFFVDVYQSKNYAKHDDTKKIEFNYRRPLMLAVISTIVALTIRG